MIHTSVQVSKVPEQYPDHLRDMRGRQTGGDWDYGLVPEEVSQGPDGPRWSTQQTHEGVAQKRGLRSQDVGAVDAVVMDIIIYPHHQV